MLELCLVLCWPIRVTWRNLWRSLSEFSVLNVKFHISLNVKASLLRIWHFTNSKLNCTQHHQYGSLWRSNAVANVRKLRITMEAESIIWTIYGNRQRMSRRTYECQILDSSRIFVVKYETLRTLVWRERSRTLRFLTFSPSFCRCSGWRSAVSKNGR